MSLPNNWQELVQTGVGVMGALWGRLLGASRPQLVAGGAALWLLYVLKQKFFPSWLSFKDSRLFPNATVVISGCDTGFGYMLARRLDRDGYCVVALCLTKEGVAKLAHELSEKAEILRVDITKQEDIDGLRETLRKQNRKIHALVNNAGIARCAHVEATSMQNYRTTMEVNCFGHIAMTKALLPLIARGGRVVNMTSVAGRISPRSMSSYTCSKYAFEAFSDCLRREMFPFGIHVCTIEPTFMRTALTDDVPEQLQRIWAKAPEDVRERYGEEYLENIFSKSGNIQRTFLDPKLVVSAYAHCVGASKPLTRYMVGKSAVIFIWFGQLPDMITDTVMGLAGNSVVPVAARRNQSRN